MDRVIGTAALLLGLVIALPVIAAWAQTAVPVLVSLLVLLGFVRLIWPSRRRS